jgi:nucleoid-associated protein YgaU
LSAATSPSGSLRRCVPFILIFSLAFAGAWQCRAQGRTQQSQDQSQTPDRNSGVAEAARQERARKQNQQKKNSHVYTAEDLKRERILTPEDRGEFEARKSQQTAAPPGPAKLEDGVSGRTVARDAQATTPSANSAEVSLGDIARRLRREKESQQLQRSAEFPLPFADAPVLASPRPSAQPLCPSVTLAPSPAVVPAPRVIAPRRPFVRRSPFERPRVLPAPPALSPAPHTPGVPATPPGTGGLVSPTNSSKLTTVTVKPGDSLWKLAASRLGDGRRWRDLITLNPGLPNPDLLEVGSLIVVPAPSAPPPALAKYTVRHGDSLSTIAQTRLGQSTAWSCIMRANPDLRDENLVREGQVLLLPASCLP